MVAGSVGNVAVAGEFTVLVEVSGREGKNGAHQTHQIFGLAGKDNLTLCIIPIVQRPDTDGISGCHKGVRFGIVEDAGKFCIQHGEHIGAVFFVHGQQHLAVGVAAEGVLPGQGLTDFFKAVDLAVAHHCAAVQGEGLHPLRVQTHDGKPVKAQKTLPCGNHPGIVRTSGNGAGKALLKGFGVYGSAAVTNNGTHSLYLLKPSQGEPLGGSPEDGVILLIAQGSYGLSAHQTAARRRWGRASTFRM